MRKKIVLIPAGFIAVILVAIIAFLLVKASQVNAGREETNALLDRTVFPKLANIGSINTLSVLPIIDFLAENEDLRTEPGVSYLVRADDTTILMDVGYNAGEEHPSPLLQNMKALNVKLSDIDMIFISHLHVDHLGGMREMKKGEFSLSRGPVKLGEIPVYAPSPLRPSEWNSGPKVRVLSEPTVIAPGIVSTGPIPRFLFLVGKTDEQVLALNLKGKGIVLVIGCGHPTVERIIQRAKMLFDQPIYAVIGGLHFPVKGGRGNLGPINVQYIVGADRAPWRGLDEADVDHAIEAIRKERISILSLSPHDSSDWSLERFHRAFQNEWVDLKVGKELLL
ncbi:MAG: MBL fold metallo-hydrolase [Spirochaetes bacterium]|nr:MBL fold metallo-hydrolase [Spirochaetota bacterium]